MNQKILGISGKKQAGKDTLFKFLMGLEMIKSALVRGNMTITKDGKLWISDLWGNEEYKGFFDHNRQNESVKNFLSELVYPFIKDYSFADILKQDVCINILGLTYEQCYGTDEQKNSLTELRWSNMPRIHVDGKTKPIGNGFMTAREVMQWVGTEVFRAMYWNVWADSTLKRIQSEKSEFAIVTDVRFPNEIEAIQNAGGKVIRLTRDIFEGQDQHESETALDKDKYDWDNFDHIIDNYDLTVDETNVEAHKILTKWGWLENQSVPMAK